MHFDFRIEVDGVLKSWAVPKGPSTDSSEKRLAVATEDHPLEYADFEGVIPEGEYGAGTVIVWDAGPYKNITEDDNGKEVPIAKALKRGIAEIWLEGKKLRGGYALVHSKVRGNEKSWLLVKMKDDAADARRNPVSTEPKSVLSGRTLKQVRQEGKNGG
jgi:DNA ligase D-like protein (predicted 3'-phosphoesterase)